MDKEQLQIELVENECLLADGFDSAVSTGLGDIDVFSFTTYNGNDWYATGLKNFS